MLLCPLCCEPVDDDRFRVNGIIVCKKCFKHHCEVLEAKQIEEESHGNY